MKTALTVLLAACHAAIACAADAPLPRGACPEYLRLPPQVRAAEDADGTQAEKNLVAARKELFKTMAATLPAAPDIFVREGVVGDASNKVVCVWAWSTSMTPGEPVEFFLSNLRAGRQYESCFVTDAAPSDVDAALRHIGLKPGWPFDPSRLQLWPKGDRVILEVLTAESGPAGALAAPFRIESVCHDRPRDRAVGPISFAFTGSARVEDPADATRTVYAADEFDPMSIASNFNIISSVLDMPEQRSKGAVYGTMILADPAVVKPLKPVIIVLRPDPALPSGAIRDLRLVAGGTPGAITLKVDGGSAPGEGGLDDLTRLVKEAAGPAGVCHMTLDLAPGNTLSLADMRRLADALKAVEQAGGARMDPPPAGQLFYLAWNPAAALLKREGRMIQPWEVTLRATPQGLSGNLLIIEEVWDDGAVDPRFSETRLALDSARTLADKAEQLGEDRPVALLVRAPPETSASAVLQYLEPVRSAFKVVYIHGESPPAP